MYFRKNISYCYMMDTQHLPLTEHCVIYSNMSVFLLIKIVLYGTINVFTNGFLLKPTK